MQETLKISGLVNLKVFSKDGTLLSDSGWNKNIITATGLAAYAGLIGNTGSVSAFTYVAVGTSTTAVAIGQTTLGTELASSGLSRAAATVSRTTTNQTNDTLNLAVTFTVTGTQTVQEVGIFNAASSGIMGGRLLTGATSVVNGNNLQVTYKLIMA